MLGLQHEKNLTEVVNPLYHTDRMWKGIMLFIYASKYESAVGLVASYIEHSLSH